MLRARSDADRIHVAANHDVEPHARLRTDFYVTDDLRTRLDVGARIDLRRVVAIRDEHAATPYRNPIGSSMRCDEYQREPQDVVGGQPFLSEQ